MERAMATLEENLRLAQRAIEFVDGQHIRSVNMKHQFWNRTDFDMFLFFAMRCHATDLDATRRGHHRDLLRVLGDNALSRSRQKKRCKEYFKRWGSDKHYFVPGGVRLYWDVNEPEPDAQRIRGARRSMKWYKGNCNEKSSVAATWLLENRLGNDIIVWANGGSYDHAYVVYDFRGAHWDPNIANWNEEAVIVDGWTSDWYPARHPYRYLNPFGGPGGHFCGPVQLHVRRSLQAASGQLGCKEMVHLQIPPVFSPNFRLAVARDPAWTYEGRGVPAPVDFGDVQEVTDEDIIGVADDHEALAEGLADEDTVEEVVENRGRRHTI
jgi:hypothetical protein